MPPIQILLSVLATSLVIGSSAGIKVQGDGGYQDILVVVEEHIPENLKILTVLQDAIEKASKYLHDATDGILHFNQVSIVIPSSWKSIKNVTSIEIPIPLTQAHIRVDKPDPMYGHRPYVLQPGQCGEPGKYIHLTPEYLLDEAGEFIEKRYGKKGRQLLHEWSHFRYGVFDEDGEMNSDQFPTFYVEDDHYIPVTCNADVKGYMESYNGGECYIDNVTLLPRDCLFVPSEPDVKMKASIMYLPYLNSVSQFCDDSRIRSHNENAPSKQNIMCGYLPTWHVISAHDDFSDSRRKPYVKPKLNVIRPKMSAAPKYVIVMDVSGSMETTCLERSKLRRLDIMLIAVNRFLTLSTLEGSEVGLVQFSTSSKVLANLTKVSSKSREILRQKLPVYTEYRTSIGTGLSSAIEVLSQDGRDPSGGIIILLTDGEDNMHPEIQKSKDKIERSNVVINSVAIGMDAPKTLMDLSEMTGGRTNYFSDKEQDISDFDQAFRRTVESQQQISNPTIQLYMENKFVFDGNMSGEVYIDETIGNNTHFEFTSTSSLEHYEVSLTSPSGRIYGEKTDNYGFQDLKQSFLKLFVIDDAEAGKWKYLIKNPEFYNNHLTVSVTSHKRNKTSKAIVVKCWLNNIVVDLSKQSYIKIFCQVLHGYYPIVGAQVEAHIRTQKEEISFQLYDDGSGADNQANDGIYSEYFMQFSKNNWYTVSARVVNEGSATVLKGKHISSSQKRTISPMNRLPLSKFPMSSMKVMPRSAERIEKIKPPKFERFVTTDSFHVRNYQMFNRSILPPSRVFDLIVTQSTELLNGTLIELSWTSVGDDFNTNQAKNVDIRYSWNQSSLLHDFELSEEITSEDMINGNLSAIQPHHKQTIQFLLNVNITRRNLFFALKTVDPEENWSNMSNIAIASVIQRSEFTSETKKHVAQSKDTTREPGTENGHKSLVPVIVGTLVSVFGIAFIVAIIIKRKASRKKSFKVTVSMKKLTDYDNNDSNVQERSEEP